MSTVEFDHTVFFMPIKHPQIDIEAEIRRAMADPSYTMLLPPTMLVPTKNQPRQDRDEAFEEELAEDIKNEHKEGGGIRGTGLLQAVSGRFQPGAFDATGDLVLPVKPLLINMGETRWRGIVRAELPFLAVTLQDMSEDRAFEVAYRENVKRRDLNPLDKANSVARILKKHNLGYRPGAKYLGIGIGELQNLMDLLRVTPELKAIVRKRPKAMSAALEISAVKDETFKQELTDFLEKGATLAEINDLIQSVSEAQKKQDQEEKLKRDSQKAPDKQTGSRTRRVEQGGTGNVSRGRELTGNTAREAKEETEKSLAEMRRHLGQLRVWWPHLPPGAREKTKRQIEGMMSIAQAIGSGDKTI